jgi:hypothetical protein
MSDAIRKLAHQDPAFRRALVAEMSKTASDPTVSRIIGLLTDAYHDAREAPPSTFALDDTPHRELNRHKQNIENRLDLIVKAPGDADRRRIRPIVESLVAIMRLRGWRDGTEFGGRRP